MKKPNPIKKDFSASDLKELNLVLRGRCKDSMPTQPAHNKRDRPITEPDDTRSQLKQKRDILGDRAGIQMTLVGPAGSSANAEAKPKPSRRSTRTKVGYPGRSWKCLTLTKLRISIIANKEGL